MSWRDALARGDHKREERQEPARRRPTKPGEKPASVRGLNYARNPVLASSAPPWRSKVVVVSLALAFVVVACWAVRVQVFQASELQKHGEQRYAATLELPASRGRILDRHGQVLAVSVSAPTVAVDPRVFKPSSTQLGQVAALLGMKRADLSARLETGSKYVVLRRRVDDAAARQIKAMPLKGVFLESGYVRRYPESEAAAHVVGRTDIGDRGVEGVERMMQASLQGQDGSRGVIRDRLGHVVDELGEPIAPRDGEDVVLTLDAQVQTLAYQRLRDAVVAHQAKAGSVVVLDAQTGEVLALANYPSYSPNDRTANSPERARNRAVTDMFEPGSTVKPFVIASALEKGRVHLGEVFDTQPFRVGPLLVNDGSHGRPRMTLSQIVQKSSNPGTVRVSQRLEAREMGELYAAVGFGVKPDIGFPGAATGRLRPWRTWKPIEKATMAYGYGLSASLLQIAHAYTALARDGDLAPLQLIRGAPVAAPVRVFKPETAATMREMLRGTVSKEGTASLAQPVGYSAGGKTGTAEIHEGRGYRRDKHRAYFTGIAPIGHPRVVVAVMIDEPTAGGYFGGLVAAPVFKTVTEQVLRTLGVPPDLEIAPQMLAAARAPAPAAAGMTP